MYFDKLHVLHETDFGSNNPHIIAFRNTQTDDYENHWHTPLEILMPIENNYTAYINTKEYILHPYDILFVTPNVYHAYKAPESGMRYFLLIDVSVLKDIFVINQIISMLNPCTILTSENAPAIHEELKDLLLSIYNIYFSQEEYHIISPSETIPGKTPVAFNLSESLIYGKFLEIMTLIARHYNNSSNHPQVFPKNKQQEYINNFSMICNYIDTHCTENITLDEIAEMANFSKFHFSRLFKEFTHESFYKYVNMKRIEYAEKLLVHQNISITEVALSSGYSSTSAFTRMFKQINGCTPKEFRERS